MENFIIRSTSLERFMAESDASMVVERSATSVGSRNRCNQGRSAVPIKKKISECSFRRWLGRAK